VLVGQHGHTARVIGAIDDDFVKSEAIDAAAQMLQAARGLGIADSAANLLGMTRTAQGLPFWRKSHHFGGSLAFVAGQKGQFSKKEGTDLRGAVSG
jgi:acyl-CoA synthetase (NDP forming)